MTRTPLHLPPPHPAPQPIGPIAGARSRRSRLLASAVSLLAVLAIGVNLLFLAAPIHAQGDTGGYYYIVQSGDSWLSLAWRTGLSVAELQAANPGAIRPNGWLWVGERLFIPARSGQPAGADSTSTNGYWHRVRPGESWSTLSRDTGVSVEELWRANPFLLFPSRWLYVGQSVWIPLPAATPATPSREPVVTPMATVVPVPTATPAVPTATPAGTLKLPTATVAPTATRPVTPTSVTPLTPTVAAPTTLPEGTPRLPTATVAPTATRPITSTPAAPLQTPGAQRPAGCPTALAGYADAISAYLARPGITAASLKTWLQECGALDDRQGDVVQAGLQRKDSADLVVVFRDAAATQLNPVGGLLIYHAEGTGYRLVHRFEGSGSVALLFTGDLNADGRPDVVWTDTSCGAHTCFGTLFVVSWDGKAYQDWIVGEPTMASPRYTFRDTLSGGSGQEILAYGGIIGSVGAGPQRAWTETYASVEGGPYRLVGQVYDPSPCLYHRILDANRALAGWTRLTGFAPAIAAYQAALDATDVTACGNIPDELATLRDFARFRLVVAYVGAGKAGQAEALVPQIAHAALRGAAETFMRSYKASGSIIQACRDTDRYAASTPAAWQFLADWGYANPTFTAAELCPLDD